MRFRSGAPTLYSDRLTLGPVRDDHADAFMDFCTTDAARFIGGPTDREDAWVGVAMQAGQWTLRGYGTFWVSETATGTPVGRVGIFHPGWRSEPELSWVIYPLSSTAATRPKPRKPCATGPTTRWVSAR